MDQLRGMKTPQIVKEGLAELTGTLVLCVSKFTFILLQTILSFSTDILSQCAMVLFLSTVSLKIHCNDVPKFGSIDFQASK